MSFDGGGVYFGDGAGFLQPGEGDGGRFEEQRKLFREFIRSFQQEGNYKYRDALSKAVATKKFVLEVRFEDIQNYSPALGQALEQSPADTMPLLELAAADAVNTTRSEQVKSIQVILTRDGESQSIRSIDSEAVSKLVQVPGIVIAASRVRAKSTKVTLQCRNCHTPREVYCRPGMGGIVFPRRCDHVTIPGDAKCPLDPFIVMTDKTDFIDQQTLKLQEMPEDVPTGEVPRNVQVALERALVGTVAPGTRVVITGIMSIHSMAKARPGSTNAPAIRQPYIRAIGLRVVEGGAGRTQHVFPQSEIQEMETLAKSHDIYDRIAKSIAPSIYGHPDIKKAISALLFGGARKHLPDGTRLRGDINVLMLGDPGVAKSQFLKFVERVAPVGVYTSGKGSSAAGLTASVLRDPSTREFIIEGGAMVLGDGGVVCIDEFDKMRPEDRVAIHEAMEQQTISIAKAGITTVLNSRCSVLAAANPVFGRYDEERTLDENIDFQTTILSRFDMIFLVRDEMNEERDRDLARHILDVHSGVSRSGATGLAAEGDIDSATLKRYIAYARQSCSPRLAEDAAAMLEGHYVQIRNEARKRVSNDGAAGIPITVRQLEAIIRISESLAKMKLQPVATVDDVQEALRLFTVSTVRAAKEGIVEGMVSAEVQAEVTRAEESIKKRVPIGSRVSSKQLVTELTSRLNFSDITARRAVDNLVRRRDFEYKAQRLALVRVK